MNDIVSVYQNATSQLKQVVTDTPKRIKELEDILKRTEAETQDLLHLAELETFNAAEGYYIAQQFKRVRKKRRETKNELKALRDLRTIMNNNSKFESHINGLDKSLQETNKLRSYRARVRTDLDGRFARISQREGIL